MNRSRRSRASLFLMCGLLCLVTLAGTVRGSVAGRELADANPFAEFAAPSLTLLHYDAADDQVIVRGYGFTPGGKVYLAIYDQMAKRLYENRWVTASSQPAIYESAIRDEYVSTVGRLAPGGELLETFGGLCGASTLIRALDDATERWSNWQIVQPTCASVAAPTIANGLLRPDSLPNSVVNPAGATLANDLNTPSAPNLLGAPETSVEGTVAVNGEGFTAGGRIYVAIYDQMGAKLYETQWVKATPVVVITGARADVPEAHPITKTLGGALHVTFGGLCGAQVMIRAYDQQTAIWSNWLDAAPLCETALPSGYGPH